MCGAHEGPRHADEAAAALCDAYHRFRRGDLPLLEAALDADDKELVWQVALGIEPDGVARRIGCSVDEVRRRMRRLTGALGAIREPA